MTLNVFKSIFAATKKRQTGNNFTKNILLLYNLTISCFQEFKRPNLQCSVFTKQIWFQLDFQLPQNEIVLKYLVFTLTIILKNCPHKYLNIQSTDFIFRQQNNADNQNCRAESRPLCNKILLLFTLHFGVCQSFRNFPFKKSSFCLALYIIINEHY